MDKRINVGFVIQIFEKDWREIETYLTEKCDIVYVKKVPPEILLRIREVSRGEREKGRFDYVRE